MNDEMSVSRSWRSIGGTAIACCISSVVWWRLGTRVALCAVVLAAVLFVVALLVPRAWKPIEVVLNRMSSALLWGVSHLLLLLVFSLCFIPGRILLVLLRKDPLTRSGSATRSSYWETLPRTDSTERFKRQF